MSSILNSPRKATKSKTAQNSVKEDVEHCSDNSKGLNCENQTFDFSKVKLSQTPRQSTI